ncbi:MAG TPA: 30S ribosomal protein S12 methylthiotransferase RimO, partial [Polyangiaceae bacterium]
MPASTIHFVSLGCPKNRVDSEVMLGVAERAGYRHVDDASEASVIVVNTCGFIDAAKQESIATILELAEHKRAGRCEKLVVAGCLSQRHPTSSRT